jgi:type IV secretion system protein VirB1
MKIIAAFFAILSIAFCHAQTPNLVQLRDGCAPTAPLSTLAAIISAESSGNPNAIQVDFPNAMLRRWKLPTGAIRLQRQPRDAEEAGRWIAYFNERQISVDVGLMQVSTDEAMRRHISAAALLDPCTNMRTGWSILEDDYKVEVNHFGPGQIALQHALSRYNTGDTNKGIDSGYLARVMTSLNRLIRETAGYSTSNRSAQGRYSK